MSENKTSINDLNDDPSSGELTEDDVAKISGGEDAQRLTIIETVHSNGTVTSEFKELPSAQ